MKDKLSLQQQYEDYFLAYPELMGEDIVDAAVAARRLSSVDDIAALQARFASLSIQTEAQLNKDEQ